MRTSNHDSIDRCRNWNEIAYIRPPGMRAIKANTSISRSVSLEPNTRVREAIAAQQPQLVPTRLASPTANPTPR